MQSEKNPEFLRQKYQLEKSEGVERTLDRPAKRIRAKNEQLRAEGKSGPLEREPKTSGDSARRIQAYLDRLDVILNPPKLENHPKFDRKARNLALMKRFLYGSLIVKPEVVTEEYIGHQQRMAREQGHGDLAVPQDLQERIAHAVEAITSGKDIKQELADFRSEEKQMAEEIVAKITDQKRSLDRWIDYVTTDDARTAYPDWFRYWVMRSVTGLSNFDKDTRTFASRDSETVNPFPELDQAVLGKVLDAVMHDEKWKEELAASEEALKKAEKKHNKERQQAIAKRIAEERAKNPEGKIDRDRIIAELEPFDTSIFETKKPVRKAAADPALAEALDAKDFAELYALEFSKLIPTSEKLLMNTRGTWVKYEQGADPTPLVNSIERHQTGWCTAGEEVARSQLARGDFYVYYSEDDKAEKTVPRAAIRMEGESVAEVRGIAADQNLDPYIGEVVQKKMHEFTDGAAYEKKAADMRRLTAIEKKTKAKKQLLKDDLIFLYEVDSSIEGFGYQKDPRVEELLAGRDTDKDMLIIFACTADQVARSVEEINGQIKAYVGNLEPGIFQKLPDSVEYIYTSFPEGRIRKEHSRIGGKTKKELEKDMGKADVRVTEWTEDLLQSKEFTTSKDVRELITIRLKVRDLGFSDYATTEQIFARAKEYGLELCPAETGPHYRLLHLDQPMNDYVYIAMNPIADRLGVPSVFRVGRGSGGLWLDAIGAGPGSEWDADLQFVFSLRKLEPQTLDDKEGKLSVLQRLKKMIAG